MLDMLKQNLNNMDQYTIYCTPEQTKRAYKLGAPIEQRYCYRNLNIPLDTTHFVELSRKIDLYNCAMYNLLKIPITEQMCGWLEEQIDEIEVIHICDDYGNGWCYTIFDKGWCNVGFNRNFNSRKEATLAAIDALLDYLEKRD